MLALQIIVSFLILIALAATILMYIVNRRFMNSRRFVFDKSHYASAKRISERIVCFELYHRNQMIDYVEGIRSSYFVTYVTCADSCYVFYRFFKEPKIYPKNSVPKELESKFINLK